MSRMTPRVEQELLHIQDVHDGALTIMVGSPEWFVWLQEHRVFSFRSQDGNFTARKEQRAAGWYWYAYRRRHGVLRSAYLGKTDELTFLRLAEIAIQLQRTSATAQPIVSAPDQHLLLATKIIPPFLPSSMIARSRLIVSLHASTDRKLILITGPAGSGKTTLLNAWVRELTCSVAWVTLDENDNELARFWSYVLAALQKCSPGFADHLRNQLPILQVETIEGFLVLLINALATLPGKVVLVLDDYHVLTSQPVYDSVTFLLAHAPQQLCLVVSSRTIPSLPLPGLRARGALVELDFNDLRFAPQEAEALLKTLGCGSLHPENLSELLVHTEGWVTGLTLVALALREAQNNETVALGWRSNHTSFEYLASEVLARQPEEVRDFLLRSSVLESLHATLCDTVIEREKSQELLQQLERENLFLIPLDDQHSWYRYHQLFSVFLRDRLEQTYPGQSSMLHRRASNWYEANGMPSEAIAAALRACDYILAVRLIEAQAKEMLMRHEVITLGAWVSALPAAVVDSRPHLCIYIAWSLLHTTHTLSIERYLNAAERELSNGVIEEGEQRALYGEIVAIRARMAIYQDQIEQSVVLAHQALQWLDEENSLTRGEVLLGLGTAKEVLGETKVAEQAYRAAIDLSKACSNLRATMLATRSLAILFSHQGRLHQAHRLYQDGLEYALQIKQEDLPPVGFMYLGLGELCYERNDLEAAERYLREGIRLGQRGGDVKIWLLGYVGLMFVAQAHADRNQVWTLFEEAERLAQQVTFTRGLAWLELIRPRLSALLGDEEPLLTWSQECGLDPAREPDALYEEEYHQLARAFIVREEPEVALPILRCLLERAERTERSGFKIAICLSLACAYEAQGAKKQALEAMAEAIALAEPQAYMRSFLDGGIRILRLLKQLCRTYQSGKQQERSRLLKYLKRLLSISECEQPTLYNSALIVEELSAREVEVLCLLAAGNSNAEIASALVIGVNTVKTHLKNIYGKLEAHNRTQAIAQARAQDLL
ncbi:LuxR C-terminal-related transcriptional regulator [Ktedonospora formicarum]|uniref:Helix-turn-helix transcriptional regulator n=1 Tax=Ktedonospora formicarum TaxID=2778364 RepID=A0A8J3I6M3_9CHLR|nr:LuxR C-terminal-related transcriptional regulator [Ktedonospora formicarum]GHO46369.1 helix-turn-helix transcriptional regulator [Ktedonospora formicarum]